LGEEGIASVITEAYTANPEAEGDVVDYLLPSEYDGICIAKVNDYVNIRSLPSEDGEILGKLYNESAGTVEEEVDGWYKITSGSVTGYVKSDYVVTGEEAEELAKEVGKRVATVTTETLRVRSEASTEASILGLIGQEEELTVLAEEDGWVQVSIEEGDGWVSTDYVELRTDFVQAESKEEEAARLAKEEAAKQEGKKKAAAAAKSAGSDAVIGSGSGSSSGRAVVSYASQFVGNPYVYGGTSLTNGADCSGFVLSVYAHFGVSLPHSSSAMRSVGYAVSIADAQPGDIICYSGHVAIYCGNNTIVHASTASTGIKYTSPANYKTILAVRRIF
jgi:cell wall-associated NlpC family hydrolase